MTDIRALVEASSLGTPAAKAARESARPAAEYTEHHIMWDHDQCEHAPGDDHCCAPDATITCEADPTEAGCRYGCDICEEYSECDDSECSIDYPHCTQGHTLETFSYCNAVEYITDGDTRDSYDPRLDWPRLWADGPIVVEWTGEGYLWHYPVVAP